MLEAQRRSIQYIPLSSLQPDPKNPRLHGGKQTHAIAESIKLFGFNAPILVDGDLRIVAGHGRYLAALLLKLETVPVVKLTDLSRPKLRAFMLADNKLNELSSWDLNLVGTHLKELDNLSVDFELTVTGFEAPEIDYLIHGNDSEGEVDRLDTFAFSSGPAISILGDLWTLGDHRLLCGDALSPDSYSQLLLGEKAVATVSDPPYNVKIDGHVSGLGKKKHREFEMASGEMSSLEFKGFLADTFSLIKNHTTDGAVIYICMDWRHMREILQAADEVGLELLNVCVWNKTNGGMGSFYRSKHELVFVFRNGDTAHINNIQLGKNGRNRTNVWTYPGANVFSGSGKKRKIDIHPTVKPLRLVSDAILDCTSKGDLVLDPFCGSGTAILAAQTVGRRAACMELDPLYVDTAIRRWQDMTHKDAIHSSGKSFSELAKSRGGQ